MSVHIPGEQPLSPSAATSLPPPSSASILLALRQTHERFQTASAAALDLLRASTTTTITSTSSDGIRNNSNRSGCNCNPLYTISSLEAILSQGDATVRTVLGACFEQTATTLADVRAQAFRSAVQAKHAAAALREAQLQADEAASLAAIAQEQERAIQAELDALTSLDNCTAVDIPPAPASSSAAGSRLAAPCSAAATLSDATAPSPFRTMDAFVSESSPFRQEGHSSMFIPYSSPTPARHAIEELPSAVVELAAPSLDVSCEEASSPSPFVAAVVKDRSTAVTSTGRLHPSLSRLRHSRASPHSKRKRPTSSTASSASAANDACDASGVEIDASATAVGPHSDDQNRPSKLRKRGRFGGATTRSVGNTQLSLTPAHSMRWRQSLTLQRTWRTHHWQLHASTDTAASLALRWCTFLSEILQRDHSSYWSVIPGEVEQFSARDFLTSPRGMTTVYPLHRTLLSDTEQELRTCNKQKDRRRDSLERLQDHASGQS
jgi:hypothetical protein